MDKLDEYDFRGKVYDATKGAALSDIVSALTYFCRVLGETTEADVQRCVKLVRHLEKDRTQNGARSLSSEQEASSTTSVALPPTPTSRARTEEYLRRMQPWLEQCRHALTGRGDPPCLSPDAMMAWLIEKDRDTGTGLLADWDTSPNASWEALVDDMLRYVRTSTEAQGVLAALEYATRKIADITGFTQVDLVTYVLVGTKPVLPAARVMQHALYQPAAAWGITERHWVTVDISDMRLTEAEVRALIKQLRQMFALERRKALTVEEEEIWRLVEAYEKAHGTPPQKGERGYKAYTDPLRRQANEVLVRLGGEPIKTVNGWKKRYNTTQNKVHALQRQRSEHTAQLMQQLGIPPQECEAIQKAWQTFLIETPEPGC